MREPMPTVQRVDLDRFMGDWFVVAHIPAPGEGRAYNGVESYRLTDRGDIDTTYTFNVGSFDGKPKIMRPKGFVKDGTGNAEWRMRFVWPFKAEYLIVHLDDDYTETIIGRTKRDYAWIMTRAPLPGDDTIDRLTRRLESLGYDTDDLRLVPQQPLGSRDDGR